MSFRAPVDGDAATRRRWVVIAGVTALVLLDVILVVWVLGRPQSSESGSQEPIAGAPSTDVTIEPEPDADPDADPPDDPGAPAQIEPVASGPAARILTAVDGDVAWRATTGECPAAAASPEFSTDGGASWTTTDATGPTGVTALQRIIVSSADVAAMVGAAADDCTPTLIRTYVAGDNYADYPAEVVSAWHVDPADRALVNAPGGAVEAPCAAVVAVAAASDVAAAVLCADGSVSTTTDAGAAWSTPVAVAGAQALAPTDGGFVVARLGGTACEGVGVAIVDAAGAGATDTGCLPVPRDPATLAGQVAVSDGGGTLWLWAGEAVVRSTDRGATWG
ncbi:hypothetical protein GCM10009792_22540 [Microcella alkalica]|uniref:Exo-alpha-sialidase n=1 Tax=Microcella alkalica TaxID=355930 RepID=A0A839ECJ7_9MICO|nr:hypothetical protein [Microcella alkalica]MBA8848172.1 hypothetical protein [Microcella alkalica]